MADMNPAEVETATTESEGSVTIAKAAEGFTVNGQPAATLDEALEMARAELGEASGGMSPEQAFQGGFDGQVPGY